MGPEWPLTGRAEELSAIETAMRSHAGSLGIVLAGAAGVGKTRLAREVLAAAAARGRHAHWVSATQSSQQLPLGALALLVGDVGGDPTQVLQHAADALLASPGRDQPVIVADDAHLLDDLSASLMQQLVAQRRATVVLTLRSGEPAPHAVEAVWRDGYLPRLEVQALSLEETTRLIGNVLGGPVEERSALRLFDLSAGNVLFLRHIVEGELAAGRLRDHSGRWRWDGQFALPTELAELAGRRLVGLPAEVCELLDVLALADGLDRVVLEQLTPRSTIEEAETAGLVRVDDERGRPVVRLAHPLYGEVRLAGLGRLRARRIRGCIATALAEVPEPSSAVVLRRAALSLESDLPADATLLTAAAQHALGHFDLTFAERLATAAVEAGGGFEASLALSYVFGFGLDPVAADRILGELVAAADGDLQLLRASAPRAAHLFYMQGRVAEGVRVLEQTRDALADESLRPIVDAMLAMFAAMSGDCGTALRLAAGALESTLPVQTEVCARWARVTALAALGRTDEFGPAEESAHELATGSYDASLPGLGYLEMHVRALHVAGRIRDAADLANRLQRDIQITSAIPAVMGESVDAHVRLARGAVRTARDIAARCVDTLRNNETSGWAYVSALTLANACAMAGDGVAARAAAEAMERERHPAFTVIEPERLLTWAWVEAAEGSTTGAVERARDAASLAAGLSHAGYEAFALATAVRFGHAAAADRLTELTRTVDGPRVAAAAQQAAGLARSDGGLLLAASKIFEEMGDLLSAADAAAQAATCFASHEDRPAHQAANARARRLRTECEDALTPALSTAVHALPLTEREREIVALAGAGLSNRDIADRLVVSVRTVEGHLYRAAAKLGTSDRRRFSALLRGE